MSTHVPLEERISRYMDQVEPAISGNHGHDATFRAAAILVNGFGLSVDQAWPFALEYNARCEPPWNEQELRRKLNQAAIHPETQHPSGYLLGEHKVISQSEDWRNAPVRLPSPPKPAYRPDVLTNLANKLPSAIDAPYLEARSKFTCWNRSPAGVLHKLYQPGEHVVVFKVFESQGCEVWTHPGLAGDLATLDYLQAGQQFGAWFMANPVDGEYVLLDRLKSEYNPTGRSRRCEECVTAWRYLVIESDQAPTDLWLRALVQLPLRIASISTSGGKSVHALVRIDAESKAHWDEIVRMELKPILVALGACGGTMTAVRLTRLPNCMRAEKGQLQRLLYLCDEPDPAPICEKPSRESPEAVWIRWSEALIHWSYDNSINPDTDSEAQRCAEGLQGFAHRLCISERLAELEALHVT